ncbi:hypothetical protein EYF80_049506 [Liparis tanakae]|uniref:Uncharacterized protein n=1 Tax=Liparis tanakae TaxID=230148 RepID=A0A4Z2FGJ7_9TELE|nr:hypothetical protein EYF80_049506 [Liparis tanakae]
MEDFTVESTFGARVQLGTEDQLKQWLFYPCLDRMLVELNSQFSDVGAGLMKGFQACNQASDDFFSEDSLELIATNYKNDSVFYSQRVVSVFGSGGAVPVMLTLQSGQNMNPANSPRSETEPLLQTAYSKRKMKSCQMQQPSTSLDHVADSPEGRYDLCLPLLTCEN